MTKTMTLKKRVPRVHHPIKHIVTDGLRHLICLPYSIPHLHVMGAQLGLGRHWFHKDHYDIPVNRRIEIEQNALLVSPRVIFRVVGRTRKVTPKQMAEKYGIPWTENMDHESVLYQWFKKQGKTGVHLCPDWDYMAIHDGSPEFDACTCSKESIYGKRG